MKTFLHLLKHNFRLETVNLERLLSPLLFSLTILLLFHFAFGEVSTEFRASIYIAQSLLSGFIAIQLGFARAYEPEEEDDAFLIMRTYPLSAEGWFFSKYLIVLGYAFLILLGTQCVAYIFDPEIGTKLMSPQYFFVQLIALTGPTALGVLLAAMMQRADAKQILFPLLYFPLTTPVLLAAVQVSMALWEGEKPLVDLLQSWLGLLLIFDVIYCTVCTLFFGELLKAE